MPTISTQRRTVQPRIVRYLLWAFLAVAVVVLSLLRWGGYLLIADASPLPPHVDIAVVLQGSVLGEKARVAGAVALLRQETTDRILISVPKESYWGSRVAPSAYAYIDRIYGHDVASRVDFCETGDVDSTQEEARALFDCIQDHKWSLIAIVTSDYHTRRTEIIWKRMLIQRHSSLRLFIHAVRDPEFHSDGWWRERRSAKTWVMEFMKLIWTLDRS